jgi:hypothetical protein
MTERPVDLDHHRGMAAQKATTLRRLVTDVAENATRLRHHQEELEAHLLASPSANWPDAAAKARYVLGLYAASVSALDPRTQTLIAAVLTDFDRLSNEE